jgi:hypothetical protein
VGGKSSFTLTNILVVLYGGGGIEETGKGNVNQHSYSSWLLCVGEGEGKGVLIKILLLLRISKCNCTG